MKTNGQLKSGDLDSSIDILTTIALADMFEIASEEKEVKEMTSK